jgi:hypothetical protein
VVDTFTGDKEVMAIMVQSFVLCRRILLAALLRRARGRTAIPSLYAAGVKQTSPGSPQAQPGNLT